MCKADRERDGSLFLPLALLPMPSVRRLLQEPGTQSMSRTGVSGARPLSPHHCLLGCALAGGGIGSRGSTCCAGRLCWQWLHHHTPLHPAHLTGEGAEVLGCHGNLASSPGFWDLRVPQQEHTLPRRVPSRQQFLWTGCRELITGRQLTQ